MTTIAIIVARGGSKRLPNKNMMDFCGRPLIAWSIIQARACPQIDSVFVTTDSEKIAEISRNYGAVVLMRDDPRESMDITGGGVPTAFAAIKIMKMQPVDAFVYMFPTSPLRKPNDLTRLVKAHEEIHEDFIFVIPIRDAFIYKKIDHVRYRQVIANKNNDYLYDVGGTAIVRREYLHEHHIGPSTFVDWDDPTTWQEKKEQEPDSDVLHYLTVEDWQKHEIDYQADFDLCEFFFERYLLAEWEAIYERLYERE